MFNWNIKEAPFFTGIARGVGGAGFGKAAATAVVIGPIIATGGTKGTTGLYTIHTFTASGALTVSGGSGNVEYLVVGGGAGGQSGHERGGAGGQVITGTLLNVSAPISVTVGGGGPASGNGPNGAGNAGSPSSFGPISTSSAPSGGPGPAPNNASAGSGGIGAPGTGESRAGGAGAQSSITGSNLYYGGGGVFIC